MQNSQLQYDEANATKRVSMKLQLIHFGQLKLHTIYHSVEAVEILDLFPMCCRPFNHIKIYFTFH